MMSRLIALTALLVVPGALAAQGSIGSQGFGYPTGQLSTGALATGGATAEIDPASPINPAALASARRYSVYFQFEPEYRRTSGGGVSGSSSTMRFPGFMATGGYRRFMAGVSFSTLLDRTWSNTYSDSQAVGGELFPSTMRAASNGAINDVRFGAAYYLSDKLQVGLGVHAIAGENRLQFGRSFPDSTGLGVIGLASTINYAGSAFSAGAVAQPIRGLVVAASARFGGELNSERDGRALAEGEVPSRYGVGVTWFGIPNTTLAARVDRTTWTDMRGLGSDSVSMFDATEIGVGLDLAGPRVFGQPSVVRFGARDRGLPFGVEGSQVNERSVSGGVGVPLARGRAQIDLTLQRSTRKAAGFNEKAWFVGIGLGIRP